MLHDQTIQQQTVRLGAVEISPRRALGGLMLLMAALLIGAGAYKYSYWGHGFDMVDFHMPIWGTTQGMFLLVSRYNFTDTFMGLDVALGFLPAIPFYAIIPSAYTLVVLQTLLLVSAAIPVYLIARDQLGGWAGVAFAALYLLYPTTQFMGMAAPFQPRVPALVLFFWAFWALERRRLWLYLALLGLAMLARTDAALVAVAFGMVAALRRAPWGYSIPPMVVGLAYFYVAITYITPQFYSPSFTPPPQVEVPFDLNRDYNDMWPCGVSPQACYYMHLGGSIPNIVKNILTHPVEVFFFVFQPAKLEYLLLMFAGLLFLPIFAPRELLLAAPVFAINLLSNRVYQYVITEQYQILAIPGMVIAAIYGGVWIANVAKGREKRETKVRTFEREDAKGKREDAKGKGEGAKEAGAKQTKVGPWALAAMVGLVALLNIPLKNPVVSAIRYPERPERVALMERMKEMIPPDAVVAATSFQAPHLLPRTEIYYIPGGPMHHQVDEAEYAFIDARSAALRAEAAKGNDIVARLRADPAWEILAEEDDLILLRKR